jgi:hypothetical protein
VHTQPVHDLAAEGEMAEEIRIGACAGQEAEDDEARQHRHQAST